MARKRWVQAITIPPTPIKPTTSARPTVTREARAKLVEASPAPTIEMRLAAAKEASATYAPFNAVSRSNA